MAYLSLLDQEGIDSQFLALLSPKIKLTGFSVFSGSVYSKSFANGYIDSVFEDGVALTQATSSALSVGEFYFDESSQTLYVRMGDSSNPSTKFIHCTFTLYYGTKDEHWYRDPLDTGSSEIYYEAKIAKTPVIKLDISASLYGFQPVQRSQLTLINTDHALEQVLYDASFSNASIKVYHVLRLRSQDEINVANVKLVYNGFCGSTVNYTGSTITVETTSGEDELSVEYRNSADSFYDLATFPELDPAASSKPIRYVYGVVNGFVPINVDYKEYSTASTSDNRVWSVIGEQSNLANVTASVGGGVHTTTKTFLTALLGLSVGDSVHMDRAAGTDEYVIILTVGADFITHAALAIPMANGDTVKRSFVGNLTIIQNNIVYQPLFGRDYATSGALSGGCAGFTLINNFEANLPAMTTLTPNDKIFCRVYGRVNDLTLSGPTFGSNDSSTWNITNPIMVILDLFKRTLGISESRLNAASFAAALSLRSDALGFAIPATSSDKMPTVKEIISEIIESSLLRVYIDAGLNWAVDAVEPLSISDISIDDNEILKESFSYNLSYRDIISEAIVQYAVAEEDVTQISAAQHVRSVQSSSDTARLIHGITRSKTIKSLLFKQADAEILASRYVFLFGDREGTVSFKAKSRFFPTAIGDVLSISRTKMLGFEFDTETEHERDFTITVLNKDRTTVTISAVDQKGIDDNESSW